MKAFPQSKLLNWFGDNQRPLPWRQKTRNPYKIWISEVMLQQTTSAAVIPYYKKFVKRFPTLKSLAEAQLEAVYENWSGLGYYSRARNLHKAAKVLNKKSRWPNNFAELIELPGFGPYTSRSVASLAFGESVGVLDGNVIRVMSRFLAQPFRWWEGSHRKEMQEIVDHWVDGYDSAQMNQALMELGATICLPKNPKCLLCPLMKSCEAQKLQQQQEFPISKPKRPKEIWLWSVSARIRGQKLYLVPNDYAPFLKSTWFPEGIAKKAKKAPNEYDFRHTITHHEIYVRIDRNQAKVSTSAEGKWVSFSNLKKTAPASLVQKALKHALQK